MTQSFDPLRWLERLLLPLVAGGNVRVGDPIGVEQLDRILRGPLDDSAALARQIATARHGVAAELVLDPPAMVLDDAILRLAVGVHNLLFLGHPAAAGTLVRRRRLNAVAAFTERILEIAAPTDERELVARHTLLHHLFDLGRDDVRISFWAGRREYRGAQPPVRLLKWRGLRRVREEHWRVSYLSQVASDPVAQPIVLALLRASPLTDLLEPTRLEPPLDLAAVVHWLRQPAIAHAVIDRYLTAGIEQVGPPLAAALVRLLHEKDAVPLARTALAFLCHLHLLLLLGPRKGEPVMSGHAHAQGQPSLRDFLGLFAAAQQLGIDRPADIAPATALSERITEHGRTCRQQCGEKRVMELERAVARGLGHAALAS